MTLSGLWSSSFGRGKMLHIFCELIRNGLFGCLQDGNGEID